MQTEVRLTWPWRLIAPAIAAIGCAYPFLVRFVEERPLTRGDILPPVAVLLFAAGYWWYCAHRASLGESSVTFHSPFRRRELQWDDVAALTTTASWITAVDRSGSRYRVSAYAAGGDLLAARLRQAVARRHGG